MRMTPRSWRLASLALTLTLVAGALPAQQPGEPTGRMGPYLGEAPPGVTPRVFAPGIVSRPETREYAASLSPDGREFYFTRTGNRQVIMVSRVGPQGWTFPEPVTFSAGFSAHEPHVTYDNRRIFWGWFRPTPRGETSRSTGYGIYMAERTPTGWSEARYVGEGMAVSSTRDGRLFLTDYGAGGGYLAEVTLVDGRFGAREQLRGGMDALRPALTRNTAHPAVAPDGSYIVFDIGGGSHLFVCFRNADGTWGEPIDLTRHGIPPDGGIASVSPDGQYLFFDSGGDIYWVSTRLIEELRPGARSAPPAPDAAAIPVFHRSEQTFPPTTAAQLRPRQPSARERQALLLAAAPLIQRGYQPSEGRGIAGSLNSGATWSSRFDFLPGERVALVAVCDSNCRDLVMRLRDASGNDAATDVAPGGRAILEFTVSATPKYALTIELAACGRNPCRWAFFSPLRPWHRADPAHNDEPRSGPEPQAGRGVVRQCAAQESNLEPTD